MKLPTLLILQYVVITLYSLYGASERKVCAILVKQGAPSQTVLSSSSEKISQLFLSEFSEVLHLSLFPHA